jgi:NTP pyrophosphatase (non-canonical NTP hydrolase)
MVDMAALHEKVWDFRRAVQHKWPTPEPVDALRFAITEVGEVMDAYLRQNDKWVRNNDRDIDIDAELGDLAVMLLTAVSDKIPEDRLCEFSDAVAREGTVDDLAICVSYSMEYIDSWVFPVYILDGLEIIAYLTDIEREVDRCLSRLATKHELERLICL